MTRYEYGFLNKCAEYGVGPNQAIGLMKAARRIDGVGDGMSVFDQAIKYLGYPVLGARQLYDRGFNDAIFERDFLDRQGKVMATDYGRGEHWAGYTPGEKMDMRTAAEARARQRWDETNKRRAAKGLPPLPFDRSKRKSIVAPLKPTPAVTTPQLSPSRSRPVGPNNGIH